MHPHRKKNVERSRRARLARQAWKNYAALEGFKAIFDHNMVTLVSSRDGVVRRTTGINVTMSPARVIENPGILAWFLDIDSMASIQAREQDAQKAKQRLRIKYDEADLILAGYHHRRASRAK